MRVKIFSSDGITPACPLMHLDPPQYEAEKVPYTNKISGQSDPMIMFTPPIRWAHESTLKRMGYVIKEVQ